jgi:CubicO group peptidase (beta-lactamase class C family)
MQLEVCGDQSILEPVIDGVDGPLDRAMQTHQVPGLTVAVVRAHEIVAELAAGRCPATERPITPDTLFQVGSTSKLVTAVGVLALADAARIPLDVDVGEVLRGWRLPRPPDVGASPVTVAALLSHTAGCTVHGFLGYGPGEPVPDLLGVLEGRGNSPAVEVGQRPGDAFEYSGGGYCVVQQVVADVTGEPFAVTMRGVVLAPSGCTTAGFDQPLAPEREHLATAGAVDGRAIDGRWRTMPELAAAGLWSNASDVARVLIHAGRRAGDPTTAMSRLVVPVVLNDGRALAHGVGAALDDAVAPTTFSHGGRTLGFCSENAMTIDGRDGVVVLTNGFPGGRDLARGIMRSLMPEP